MFEGIKIKWRQGKENRKRRRITKEIETGKRSRGRTTVAQNNPDSSVIASRLKGRGSISARIIRKDGTIEDLGIISKSKEEVNG